LNTLKYLFIAIIALYGIIGVVIYYFQEKFIFLPTVLPDDFKFQFDQPFEELLLKTHDGGKINVLYFHAEAPKGLIVYFHGNAGSLERWGNIVAPFVGLGYDLVISDYRGYGKSRGKRSQKNLLDDAVKVYSFAQTKAEENDIILFGRSLGTGFASYLAGKYDVSKVILETPFYSLESEANRRFMIYPVSWLLRYQLKNHQYLKTNQAPVFIFHGTADKVVSYTSGTRLYESISSNGGEFVTIEGGFHNNLSEYPDYWEAMKRILD